MTHKRNILRLVRPLMLIVLLCACGILLFFTDNKYQTPPPYGNNGIICLTADEVRRDTPVFLIDGWLLTDNRVTNLPTYIGQFSNLQRGNQRVSPHGSACYQITLRYSGEPIEVAISFSQLFYRHNITIDGKLLSKGEGGARVSFTLVPGDHLLKVNTDSRHGYYSGMYHPPAIGTTKTVSQLVLSQCIAYGLAFCAPLVLALFTMALWCASKDRAAGWFGLVCCSVSLYMLYYFVRLLSLPVGEYWYLVQSAALCGLCFCAIRLTALVGDIAEKRLVVAVQWVTGGFAGLLVVLAVLIPLWPMAVWLHGTVTDLFYIFTFCAILGLALRGVKQGQSNWEQRFTRMACVVFGMGLLYNLFASKLVAIGFRAFNLFEPIRLFWQFEWCALLLVALFGALMVTRNRRILAENAAFQAHLEDMVQERTADLTNVLRERKVFFAEMAHDLKAPIFAAGSFIQAIRAHNTGVDGELLRYIDLVEQKQQELTRRVQGLTELNRVDELSEPYTSVSVQSLLTEVYRTHRITAQVRSVHLEVLPPETDGVLYAQPNKLAILFENLIFNALAATPPGGRITIAAELDEEGCHFSVEDTGSGISVEELPRIFDRFYVGNHGSTNSSGLGLYLVKCIVDGMHGQITVSSKPGQGSVFYIDVPLR